MSHLATVDGYPIQAWPPSARDAANHEKRTVDSGISALALTSTAYAPAGSNSATRTSREERTADAGSTGWRYQLPSPA